MTRVARWIGVCGLLLSLFGCGWFQTEKSDSEADDAIPELGDRERTPLPSEAAQKELPPQNLALRLKVGDRFPLIKTVEQKLRQLSATGGRPIESSSTLTMTLAVTVEAIDQGVKTLGVRYQRVRYEHDIGGEQVRYDSALLPKSIPEAAWVYHGLVDNGFSFELGADNRIVRVHDFEAFLKRCVRHAPANQQQELLTHLVATQEDEGIANFVDDSIGLLPYNVDDLNNGGNVKLGATWRKTRELRRPLPLTIDTAYRLANINDQYATLELFGQIMPARIQHASHAVQPAGATEKMTLRGGHCFGTCTIDRDSGLPIQSHVTRLMDLTLELPTGAVFEQKKEIITTIRTFPEQGAPTTTAAAAPRESATPRTATGLSTITETGPLATSRPSVIPNASPTQRSPASARETRIVPTGFESSPR